MSSINVFAQHGKNYFTTAKNAVYGKHFIRGAQYDELQGVLNVNIRLQRARGKPLLKWGDAAPDVCKRISVFSISSFDRHLQKHLFLTSLGATVLQQVLVDRYKTMQTPA